jgi:hypothetical protein
MTTQRQIGPAGLQHRLGPHTQRQAAHILLRGTLTP